ncbi:TonB-dependent receptor [Gilvimarinus agarilyticus]|uniref:TonB-dependent receptor domain-containing protein n=1 Tax=unclassified Gilvimarinus TaxID=2642066 RepID=UPI001C08F701|nr:MULTISPECIES: TonB-dependent receptor [unclassified Gilvimarinus]MBU2884449.1 TonB-dependent receptor [Gilvimarinus agarilyticus]MDO6569585.1 TonB-dependent receptor [Gilvimarinus sp. 2_MG-2023]MDO6748090.1 TonB-dependent receptor [Gilvimarinus sp. 1_MG-2023]
MSQGTALHHKLLIGAASTTALLATMAANAEHNNQKVEEMVITASGFEQKLVDAPASISVIDQTEILTRPHVNLLDMLKYQEGIDIGTTRDKTGQGSVSMRGLTGEYTLYLIDGKRQNNHGDIYPNNFGGNAFGHMPPAEAIEQIEVIRGPASTLYGADALGGVINIITKKDIDHWFGTVNLAGNIQQNSDFGNATQADFFVAGPLIADTLALGVRGSLYDTEASSPEFEPAVDPNGTTHYRSLGFGSGGRTVDSESQEYGATLTLTPNRDHTLRLAYDYSEQVYDNTPFTNPDTGELSYPLGTKDNIAALWQTSGGQVNPRAGYAADQEFNRAWWSLSHDADWSFGTSSLSLSYVDTANDGRTLPLSVEERLHLQEMYDGTGEYAGMSEEERRNLAETTFLPRPDRPLESRQYTLDARVDIPFEAAGSHKFVLGGQVIDGELEDGVFGLETNNPGGIQKQEMYSLFVEDSWTLATPFTITAGVRYDEHDVFGSQVSPRLYGVYTINNNWTVKGGVATGYKTPQTTDLYDGITGFGGQGTSPFAGNPDLEPETSVNSEIAIYWTGNDGHNFNATYFNTRFDDKIASGDTIYSCETTGGQRPCVNLGAYDSLGYDTYSQKINIDQVDIQGVEIAGRYILSDSWSLNANYTWTDSEQTSGPEEGQPLTNTAEHMANASINWTILPNLSMMLQGEFRSDRYRSWDSVLDKPLYYKNYALLHLGITYEVTDNITVFGRVNNLLDEDFTSYTTEYVDLDNDGVYTLATGRGAVSEVVFTDNYNVKDAGRNFWVSVQLSF